MSLTTNQMLKIKELRDQIEGLYEVQDKLIKSILSKKGDSTGILEIQGLDKPFMRITLTDNYQPFIDRDAVFRIASFRRYEAKIDYLRNMPK